MRATMELTNIYIHGQDIEGDASKRKRISDLSVRSDSVASLGKSYGV